MINLIQNLKMYLAARGYDERGVTTVEYAIMLFLIALAVAAVGTGIGGAVTGIFNTTETCLTGGACS